MKKLFLASLMITALAALPACAERADEAGAASEVEDSVAVAEASEPMAAPGEDAVLVEEGEGLLARVKISDGEARVLALMKVSGGRIVRATLEEEDGRLAYAYDLVVEAQPGMITEVVVDALTGKVASVTQEKEAR
ncbi:MAG: PepSY domain-containing protein [Longimicrobiales bacterium]